MRMILAYHKAVYESDSEGLCLVDSELAILKF